MPIEDGCVSWASSFERLLSDHKGLKIFSVSKIFSLKKNLIVIILGIFENGIQL